MYMTPRIIPSRTMRTCPHCGWLVVPTNQLHTGTPDTVCASLAWLRAQQHCKLWHDRHTLHCTLAPNRQGTSRPPAHQPPRPHQQPLYLREVKNRMDTAPTTSITGMADMPYSAP
jgi:hypothetical protein